MKLSFFFVFAVLALAAARLHEHPGTRHKHSANGRNWRLTALHGSGAVEAEDVVARKQHIVAHQRLALKKQAPAEGPGYGRPKCPCVGLDNIPGSTDVTINGTEMNYPADLGAHCDKWSVDRNSACKGDNQPAWCAQPWCYVDPCDCDLDVLPKQSMLLPDARFKGKHIFYSYATCDGEDLFSPTGNTDACAMQKTEAACQERKNDCSWKEKCINNEMLMCEEGKIDESKWGLDSCPCVAVAGVPGNIEMAAGNVQVKGGLVQYPADTGATCEQWDQARSPKCAEGGADNPPWCQSKWCYVDPCNCNIPGGKVPTIAHLLKDAVFQGKPAYYSYATCGNEDLWTAGNFKDACKNQATEEACGKLEKTCAWKGSACVGWAIGSLCEAFDKEKDHHKTIKLGDSLASGAAAGASSEAKDVGIKYTTEGPPRSFAVGSSWPFVTTLLCFLLATRLF